MAAVVALLFAATAVTSSFATSVEPQRHQSSFAQTSDLVGVCLLDFDHHAEANRCRSDAGDVDSHAHSHVFSKSMTPRATAVAYPDLAAAETIDLTDEARIRGLDAGATIKPPRG